MYSILVVGLVTSPPNGSEAGAGSPCLDTDLAAFIVQNHLVLMLTS